MSKRKRRERRGGDRSGTTSVIPSSDTEGKAHTEAPPRPRVHHTSGAKRRPTTFSDRMRQLGRGGVFGIAAVVAVIAIGVYLLVGQTTPGAGQRMPDEGTGHVAEGQPLTFRNYPPSSGKHYPTTALWGVYQQEVPEGKWIHNLEHGGIVFLYNCPEGCPELQQQMEETFKTFPPGKYGQVKLIVAPYAKMEHKIAAVAWGYRLELDAFDRDKLLAFYNAHVDKGPEDVP